MPGTTVVRPGTPQLMPAARKPAQPTKTALRRLAPIGLLAAVIAAGVWYFRSLLFANNLHAVIPGQVYRSGQPSASELQRLIGRLGLRSVVSLRGGKEGWAWFVAEKSVCDARAVDLHVVHLNPDRLPGRRELQRLIAILDSCRRPVLLHCQQGIDRSGLAAAAAKLLHGDALPQAQRQFGLRYGYVSLTAGSDLPELLEMYRDWLSRCAQPHAPERFRHWAREVYVPYFYHARIEPVSFPDAIVAGKPTALRFRVTNTSPQPWQFRSAPAHGVHLGLWIEAISAGSPYRQELRGGHQDKTVNPGESLQLSASLPPLPSPGRYRLTVDLVDESVTWFADMGSPPLKIEFDAHAAR